MELWKLWTIVYGIILCLLNNNSYWPLDTLQKFSYFVYALLKDFSKIDLMVWTVL